MTKEVVSLVDICRRFLQNQISVDEYVNLFEDTFHEADADNFTEAEFSVLDEIFMDNDMFEPNALIRKGSASYIDEAELRRRVQVNISKLTA
ncbi:MAG: Bacterial self-protective colicin-like immunity [Firmicutes bacterium]|nr:Bacterial self-protective colicin-like immunity [Bacillota bacterium]